MKLFACQKCAAQLYFENVRCLSCNDELGFIPDANVLSAIEPEADGTWRALAPGHQKGSWRKCSRYAQEGICNWLVRADDPHELCRSCRMTGTIPDQSISGNREAWRRLEVAKRRLIYGLTSQGLPVIDRHQDPVNGLEFAFMADTPEKKAFTGHQDGLITINVREADPVERERAKANLHESYRTVLGHLRHESGHYYWDRLVAQGPRLGEVRALFGDDRQDYAAALKRHYDEGPPADWNDRFVSAYATMHPWEDWAETWAHHLHMVDAVEIAGSLGMTLSPKPHGRKQSAARVAAPRGPARTFDELLAAWIPLTFATNCLTRSIGQQDWFPFVLSNQAIAKLRLVHQVVEDARLAGPPPTVPHTPGISSPGPAPAVQSVGSMQPVNAS